MRRSESSSFLPGRRAALAALCAVGLHLAMAGRARAAEAPAADPTAPTAWNSLNPDEQKVLGLIRRSLGLAAGRSATAPAARHAPLAAMTPDQQEHARARFQRWQQLSPEQQALARQRWQRFRELTPEQQQRVREGYKKLKNLTPEQRRQLRERWQNATPEQRQRWLERRRQMRQRP